MKFVIVTGISGAGKTTALKILENMGFFCVDNLPIVLLEKFADLCFQKNGEFPKVAVGIDSRGRQYFDKFAESIRYFEANNYEADVLFLQCKPDVLVNRYNFTRHIHPLAEECGTVLECIEKETLLMKGIKQYATNLIDTSSMQAKDLKHALERRYNAEDKLSIKVHICSFGFKRGIPLDADYVFDVRFLPNPYNISSLRSLSGLTREVSEYLYGFKDFDNTVDMICNQLKYIIPQYSNAGKYELVYAIGCTGGYHRSVRVAQSVADRLMQDGISVVCEHRDIEQEGEKWKSPSQQ